MSNVLCIIPARGGSKGIPRKNLRPMAGKPLIYYSINACRQTDSIDRVVVSTDDEEIALFAERFGAQVLTRPDELADDARTLDPVIAHALEKTESETGDQFAFVVTVQPTSPLIGPREIEDAVRMLKEGSIDTVLSVVDDRHLSWTVVDGKPAPEYTERVNRQFLAPRFRETGAIIGCRREVLVDTGSRIGDRVGLLEVEQEKSFDIDTVSDFKLCENLLQRKSIVFNITGNNTVGMGHVYRALMIANELVGHNIQFVCSAEDDLAVSFVRDKNFLIDTYPEGSATGAIAQLQPDLVINDVLDTQAEFITELKAQGCSVINFEDLGSGIEKADLVINALYPSSTPLEHVKSGPEYFCLREEFLHLPPQATSEDHREVLLCFGGTDQGNLSVMVLKAIAEPCAALGYQITVVLGAGYAHHDSLDQAVAELDGATIEVVKATSAISNYMQRATLAITSGGRTVLELAALCTPTIIICQNEREQTHNFLFNRSGVINLGHRKTAGTEVVRKTFTDVASDADRRQAMRADLASNDLTLGKARVISAIRQLLEHANDQALYS